TTCYGSVQFCVISRQTSLESFPAPRLETNVTLCELCQVVCTVELRMKANAIVSSSNGSFSFGERIARLHKKRQELIRPVQENPREYVLLSVRALAQKLGTDPATVTRIVQGLGFESYRDFKSYLHELAIATATSLQGLQATAPGDSNTVSGARRALEQDLQNLHALRNKV